MDEVKKGMRFALAVGMFTLACCSIWFIATHPLGMAIFFILLTVGAYYHEKHYDKPRHTDLEILEMEASLREKGTENVIQEYINQNIVLRGRENSRWKRRMLSR